LLSFETVTQRVERFIRPAQINETQGALFMDPSEQKVIGEIANRLLKQFQGDGNMLRVTSFS